MMRRIIFLLITLLPSLFISGKSLYIKTFGNSSDKPLIFVHGGPGSSSVYFEATTAKQLANRGYFVIIYDRRGEGRSFDKNAKMNFEEAFKDLNSIYNTYKLKKATLIGFSFGGLITALYAEKYTSKIHSIILVSALLSQQESYDTMLESLEAIYSNQKDSIRLKDILTIREMDKNSIDYRSKCFSYASENGFFSLKNPDEAAKLIYATYNTDSLITKYIKNKYAVETFWKNEKSINIDITPKLENLKSRNINIYGLYGQEDGLYSKEQINRLADLIGCNNLKYLPNCSHTVFVDQQKQFLESISTWLK